VSAESSPAVELLDVVIADAGLDATVTGISRLSGGSSRETFAVDLSRGPGLILQRTRPGTVAGMAGEASLLQSAARAGVPVASVVADGNDDAIGSAWVLAERLPGETIARRILRDDHYAATRARLAADCGRALAAVHGIPVAEVPHLRAADQLVELRGMADALGVALPAFELSFRWLEANRPDVTEDVVVHGDFRLGNLLVDDDGLVAVLDWELSHLGDPAEDLAWLCVRAWRFGEVHPVGGFGTVDDLLGAYAAASDRRVEHDDLLWWQVLGTLKWGLICVLQASSHLGGSHRSVELATIGRRVCETEYDLLLLLP
jgi:aminoglycoside phosphotransferase (APT) family kinase protein